MHFTANGKKIEFNKNENLLCAMHRAGLSLSADCNGRGTCGKCKVKLDYFTEPSADEKELLTEVELKSNIRLACKTAAKEGSAISFDEANGQIATVQYRTEADKTAILRAICDLGTTTVTVAFADGDGNIFNAKSENNSQRIFGSDVISRIEGDTNEEQKLITEQLEKMLDCKADTLYISGNTAMLHILLGEDCKTLGAYPFTPKFLNSQTKKIGLLTYKTLPCLHSFIGADIAAGIIAAEPQSDYTLLIDLGTNAEIALFNKDNVFATSAAAGSAFEGAGISCGMSATAGAINAFKLEGAQKHISTVDQAPPKGICGSGLMDIIAAMLEHGIIDSSGAMKAESYRIIGNIALTAQDIREFQLAKAAVRSGIDFVIKKSRIDFEQIGRVLLSGGFGTYLNAESAAAVGLIPPQLAPKTEAAGNTSLIGTAKYAAGKTALPPNITVFNLAEQADFNDDFLKNLTF